MHLCTYAEVTRAHMLLTRTLGVVRIQFLLLDIRLQEAAKHQAHHGLTHMHRPGLLNELYILHATLVPGIFLKPA